MPYLLKIILSIILLPLTITSCSYTYISPEIESNITTLDNDKAIVFGGKKINIGDYISNKEFFFDYMPKFKMGDKWEYETVYKFKDTNLKSNYINLDWSLRLEIIEEKYIPKAVHKLDWSLRDIINGKPVKVAIEVLEVNKKNEIIVSISDSGLHLVSGSKAQLFENYWIPSSRIISNFAFTYILTSKKTLGLDDMTYDTDEYRILNNSNTKYKFKGIQEVVINNKKYMGYKIGYILDNNYLYGKEDSRNYCCTDSFSAIGESIFVRGIGVVRDETDIILKYPYPDIRNSRTSIHIPNKDVKTSIETVNYKAISELKNVVLK